MYQTVPAHYANEMATEVTNVERYMYRSAHDMYKHSLKVHDYIMYMYVDDIELPQSLDKYLLPSYASGPPISCQISQWLHQIPPWLLISSWGSLFWSRLSVQPTHLASFYHGTLL